MEGSEGTIARFQVSVHITSYMHELESTGNMRPYCPHVLYSRYERTILADKNWSDFVDIDCCSDRRTVVIINVVAQCYIAQFHVDKVARRQLEPAMVLDGDYIPMPTTIE